MTAAEEEPAFVRSLIVGMARIYPSTDIQVNGAAPGSGGIVSRNDIVAEVVVTVRSGEVDIVFAIVFAHVRSPDGAQRLVQRTAYRLPIDKVTGMVDCQSRQILE